MKIQILGFKNGKRTPTARRGINFAGFETLPEETRHKALEGLGLVIKEILDESDAISIKKVEA